LQFLEGEEMPYKILPMQLGVAQISMQNYCKMFLKSFSRKEKFIIFYRLHETPEKAISNRFSASSIRLHVS